MGANCGASRLDDRNREFVSRAVPAGTAPSELFLRTASTELYGLSPLHRVKAPRLSLELLSALLAAALSGVLTLPSHMDFLAILKMSQVESEGDSSFFAMPASIGREVSTFNPAQMMPRPSRDTAFRG